MYMYIMCNWSVDQVCVLDKYVYKCINSVYTIIIAG